MMPKANEYLTGGKEFDTLQDKARVEREKRAGEISKLWKYYLGQHPITMENQKVMINLVGSVVNRGVSFMMPEFPAIALVNPELDIDVVPVGESPPAERSYGLDDDLSGDEPRLGGELREEGEPPLDLYDTLDGIIHRNEFELFFREAALQASISGHSYVKLIDGEIPSVANLDTESVVKFWDARDKRRVLWYSIYWEDGDISYRQDIVPMLVAGMDSDGWIISDWERKAGKSWSKTNEDVWGYPFSPIVEWPNLPVSRSAYGLSDIPHAELNDHYSFVAANILKIIKFHGSPQTVVTGATKPADEDEQQIGPDTIIYLPDTAKIHNLEMESDLRATMAFLTMIRKSIFAGAEIVDIETREDISNITNFGLRILYGDQTARTRLKREYLGRAISETARRMLSMELDIDYDTVPKAVVYWPESLPISETEIANVQILDQQLGIKSKQTMAEERNLNWQREKGRLDTEADEKEERQANFMLANQMKGLSDAERE